MFQRIHEETKIVKTYHTGLANHRGVEESVSHLKIQYYWPNMEKTVKMFNRSCATCGRSKYVRKPKEALLEITETPTQPWNDLEIDILTWTVIKFIVP